MASRIRDLEQRIEQLEDALEMQGVMLGRWLALIDGDPQSAANAWLLALDRNWRQQLPQSEVANRLMNAPLYGAWVEQPPLPESLRLPG